VRHLRSVAYSAERVLLNKHQIWGGAPKHDCCRKASWKRMFIRPSVRKTAESR